jgi:RNA polymerase sigma-70 factor (ECF subfamily)
MSSPQDSTPKIPAAPILFESAEGLAAHYGQAYPKLVAIAAGVLGGREDAEDIVQQAAGIAIEKRQQFDTASRFIGWLAGIVRHCALNHRRKRLKRRTFAADPRDMSRLGEDRASQDVLPIDLGSGELRQDQISFDDDVLRALRGLSEEARCCLLLRIVGQASYAEIAHLMQMPEGTAMSHVHRAKQALRQRLVSHEPSIRSTTAERT